MASFGMPCRSAKLRAILFDDPATARTQVQSFTDFEAALETGRSFSVTAGRSTTFPNRRFTAPA